MSFRYGFYLNPEKDDPSVTTQMEAEAKARLMSSDNNGAPVAVWDANDRTLKLYAGCEAFVPAR